MRNIISAMWSPQTSCGEGRGLLVALREGMAGPPGLCHSSWHGLSSSPVAFAPSLPSPKQNWCLEGKEIKKNKNNAAKQQFLKKKKKKNFSVWIAHSLRWGDQRLGLFASLVSASCQKSSGSARPLWLAWGLDEPADLEEKVSCSSCRASCFQHVLAPAQHCHPGHTALLLLPHRSGSPALHQCTCSRGRINDTLICTGQCFSHSSQRLPVFLKLIWLLQMHFHNGTYSD